jgi:ATP-binding cassette subfamily B protein
MLLLVGGDSVIEGTLTLGAFTALLRYLQQMRWPAQAVGLAVSVYQRGVASAERIDQLLSLDNAVIHPTPHKAPLDSSDSKDAPLISVRSLSFSYPGSERQVLKEVSFDIRHGERLAIIGEVGSGKSTLAQILAGVYEPPIGTVFVDNHDITSLPHTIVRQTVRLVPQDAYAYSVSVKNNLLIGSPSAPSESELKRVTEIACLDEEIVAMTKQYETVIGEQGVTLSGGQRQRLAIARAMLFEAPLLVFDDSFSSVDGSTESRILCNIPRNGRTQLFVTHRLSTLMKCDRIVILQEGQVIATGTHESLLNVPWFKTFVDIQRHYGQEQL